ncbi:MAG TPA: FHA domain-containing protein [Anaeromyxobacteraceae bacterium]|nr:FHA domain-containing protein [Anaeromyxobacteraceae bacterium]
MGTCPACGAPAELGRLTGILGVVCRQCDAYNDPGAKKCASCGAPLEAAPPAATPSPVPGRPATTPAPAVPPEPGAPAVRAFPKGGAPATRYVPAAKVPSPEAPAHTPIPVVIRCPRCGDEAGGGQFCARCGQALGGRGTQVFAPAPGTGAGRGLADLEPGHARLVLERGEGGEGAVFRLNAASVEAGRTRGTVLFPSDPCLAGHHATFTYRDGGLHVRDEGAPGGIYLRLRGLTVPLRPGDAFAVGDRLLRLAGPLPDPPPPAPDGTRRLGAPRPPGAAVVVEEWLEGGVAGRVFVRGGPSVTIGRAGCAINLDDDPLLSQAHAELLVDASGAVRLRDLGSANGTFVRIPAHGERELREGDVVRMGREVLRVAVA